MSIFMHEQLDRGEAAMAAIAEYPVAVCGAGALGANVCESLARMGYKQLTVIDRDRIEERNLSTQPYGRRDVGAYKARVLANDIFRAVGTEVSFKAVELVEDNLDRFLGDAWLVIDCFDNGVSRGALTAWSAANKVACLHAGMADGYGEVVWNEGYKVPSSGRDDVCDYPLTRTLATMIAAMTCELATEYVVDGQKRSLGLTIGDFSVRPVG